MWWIGIKEVDLAVFYRFLSWVLLVVVGVFAILFLIVKLGWNVKLWKWLGKFSEKYRKGFVYVFLFLLILSVLGFAFLQYKIYDLDLRTRVEVDEKIVIIEIDDYWNIDSEGAGPYFFSYGYTIKDYKEVSDILDKYGMAATLGVTPYIFVEQIRKNFPLSEDEEMVEYLKELEDKGYELAMHGYNHCRNSFYCPQYEEVWFNVYDGKRELERIFRKPFITYLPPGNEWTTEQYKNVKKADFLVVGNTHVPRAYFDEGVIITHKGYDPIYVYNWYQKDFRHTTINEWIDDYESKNLFILQLHCNTFDSQEKLDDLDEFLAYVEEDGAKVMTYRDFYFYMMQKKDEK